MSSIEDKLAQAEAKLNEQNNDDSDEENAGDYDFVPNETSEWYMEFANARAVNGAINEALDLEKPDVNIYGLDRSDIPVLREELQEEGYVANQTYWAILAAVKSEMGDRQADENDFAIGFEKDDDGNIVGAYDGDYAAAFGDTLPATEHEELQADEMAVLEDRDIDTDSLGFQQDGNPVFPIVNGTRLPMFVENYEELDEVIHHLNQLPEEPSLGNIADETEEGGDSNALANPGDFTVPELEEHIEASDYSPADLETMLAHEQDAKDRVTAIDAIERALNNARDDEADDEADSDDESGASSGSSPNDVATSEADGNSLVAIYDRMVEDGVDPKDAARIALRE